MTSIIWKLDLYEKISKNEASCKACKRNLKLSDGSTKTLFSHTKLHPEYNERLCALKEAAKPAEISGTQSVKMVEAENRITIYFKPPLHPNGDVTKYKVYLSADPSKPLDQWQKFDAEVKPEPSIQFNRGDLEPDTPYYIRVAAENDDGEGVPSDVTQFTTVGVGGGRKRSTKPRIADLLDRVSQRLDRVSERLQQTDASQQRLDASQQRLDASQQRLEASLDLLEANIRKTSSILDRILLRLDGHSSTTGPHTPQLPTENAGLLSLLVGDSAIQ